MLLLLLLRLNELLQNLANKLNSNESFTPDGGFQVDIVYIAMPCRGLDMQNV